MTQAFIRQENHRPYFRAFELESAFQPNRCFPGDSVVKNPPANAGDTSDAGLIPGLGRSPGEGNGNLLQYSCLENPMDRGAWQAIVHEVAKSQTGLEQINICAFT